MLKRKKIVIQWRKFRLKRSCIFKVINFWSLCPFSDFYLILNWFFIKFILIFLIKIVKKGGFLFHGPRDADVASGTHADATRHARPRGRAARAHVRHRWRTGRGHVVGGHEGPRGRPGGTTWQRGWQVKGPWVSGPWLEYWGGNAIALNRPPI